MSVKIKKGPPQPKKRQTDLVNADHQIGGLKSGGTNEDGTITGFTLVLGDQTDHLFLIQTAGMPKLIAGLNQCLRQSQQRLTELGAGDEFDTSPMEVTAITKSGRNSDLNLLAIQLQTKEGIPLDLAMSPEVALKVGNAIMEQFKDVVLVPDKLDG